MSISLPQLGQLPLFPAPELALAEPNGLLAFGGDLSVERLLSAYREGIFPWFGEDEPLLWWSPDPRGILELADFNISRSFARFLRRHPYRVTLNHEFDAVVDACASVPRADNGTWITDKMVDAYGALHRAGHGHSVEVWDGDELIGGLYGVAIGRVFCGESMFHRRTNASKLAMYHLVQHLRAYQFAFIDCQMLTPHLASLGATSLSREVFLQRLRKARDAQLPPDCWQAKGLRVQT